MLFPIRFYMILIYANVNPNSIQMTSYLLVGLIGRKKSLSAGIIDAWWHVLPSIPGLLRQDSCLGVVSPNDPTATFCLLLSSPT